MLSKIKIFLGNLQPLPNWIKNFALVSIILVFIGCLIFLSYLKEWDKVVALAGILVGIVSSPIFSIRAELEKHTTIYLFERKYNAYFTIYRNLTDMIRPLGSIDLANDFFPNKGKDYEEFIKNHIQLTKDGMKVFLEAHKNFAILFNKKLREMLKDLSLKFTTIQNHFDNNDFESKKIRDLISQANKQLDNIISYMQQELGINK